MHMEKIGKEPSREPVSDRLLKIPPALRWYLDRFSDDRETNASVRSTQRMPCQAVGHVGEAKKD